MKKKRSKKSRIDKLKMQPSHRKGKTQYAALYKRINALNRPGKFIVLPVPKSVKSGVYLNRLGASISNGIRIGHLKGPPKRCIFKRRTLLGGKTVAILCKKK